MARERMITRTIKSTIVKAMICDTKNASITEQLVTMGGTFKGFERGTDGFNACQELPIWSMTQIVVKVDFVGVQEKLYGMPENVFMQYAVELPPRATNDAEPDAE